MRNADHPFITPAPLHDIAPAALAGGPVGAVVGAGAGGGLVANKIRKHHGIKKKEERNAVVPE